MPGIKTDDHISERLLTIDWGKPDSERRQAAPQPDLAGRNVSVRIDEVFQSINAYRALIDVAESSLLTRSLISQANAIFNQAFINLEQRHHFAKVYVDPPLGNHDSVDITDFVVDEVRALQNILDT
jgi:hypothetical protein